MPETSPQLSQPTVSTTGTDTAILKHGLVVFSILLIVYLATMPLTIALEDDGLFILSSAGPGISHPPGYPLHTLIGHAFSKIPIGSVAARVHAVSAFFGAMTCLLVYLLIGRLVACRSIAYLGSLSYGLSLRFWSQSLVAEIYTLNTFFFFLLLYLCVRLIDDKPCLPSHGRKWFIGPPGRLLASIAFIYGLSLSNHWPLMVLSTPALLVLLWPKRFEVLSAFGSCLILAIIGLSPYLWMYLYSQTDPYISFYGPLENWSDLWYYISRQGYSAVDASFSAGPGDKIQYLGFFLKELTVQFGLAGFGLACIGALLQFKYLKTEIAFALVFAFLGNGVLLVLLLGFDYQWVHQSVFSVYPLIAYGVMGIWLAIGAHWLAGFLYQRLSIAVPELKLRYIFTSILVMLIFIVNLQTNNRHSYTWAEEYSLFILDNLEKDAVLFAMDDVPIGTIGYMSQIQNIRPDIDFYNKYGLLFGNRLYSPLNQTAQVGEQKTAAFIKDSERPIYYLNELETEYGFKSFLFYYEVDRSSLPGSGEVKLTQASLDFLVDLLNQKHAQDSWTEIYKILLLESIVPEISDAIVSIGPGELADSLGQILAETLGLFNCQVARIKWLKGQSNERYSDEINQLLNLAENNMDNAVKKSNIAEFYQQKAQWQLRKGELVQAFESYQRSIDSWFHPKNQSVKEILNLYKLHGKTKQFDQLIERVNATH